MRLLAITAALAVVLAAASAAHAAHVLVLDSRGHAIVHNDPFLAAPDAPQLSMPGAPLPLAASARTPQRDVRSELAGLHRAHAISDAAYRRYLASWNRALATEHRLSGTRAAELEAVIGNIHRIAATGLLTASRLPVLFLTLDRNRTWWSTGPLLSYGERVQFAGSQLVWEYYPGQGIELQELGSWSQIHPMYRVGPRYYPRIKALLSELIPLAVQRAGGLAWEYYFSFDGGSPPWTSAMSQGTAIQALTNAYQAFHDPAYLELASRALGIFEHAPPTGVSVETPIGSRYLLYSFAPGAAVINGFLQSLIGLFNYAKVSGDGEAWRLFHAGDAEARAELPRYDTGAWSLYQPGQEDSLDYHLLVTSFLHHLCRSTHTDIYCTTAAHFSSYLKTPPVLALITKSLRRSRGGLVWFRLSKISHVGIRILRGSQTVFLTSASFAYGSHAFAAPPLSPAGTYTVRLGATDLAGNWGQTAGTVQVSGPAQRKKR